MQRDLKFALFGNTYQEHKSAHVTHLLEILRKKMPTYLSVMSSTIS